MSEQTPEWIYLIQSDKDYVWWDYADTDDAIKYFRADTCISLERHEELMKEQVTAKNIIETFGESFACKLIHDLEEIL